MNNVATASINSFGIAPPAEVPPSEDPIFVLTSSQLRQIVADAIQGLEDEVAQLREERDQDRQDIASLRDAVASMGKQQDTLGENQLIQLQLINQPKEEIKPTAPDESSLIDELYQHMRAVGLKQTTFAGAAKSLDRSKGRIKQLHPLLAMDQRFIILPSESHKQRLLIRLREFYERV